MDDRTSLDGRNTLDFPDDAVVPVVRARRHLKRALDELDRVRQAALDVQPLTGLPGAISIEREVVRAMDDGTDTSVVLADAANLEAYNAAYGLEAGDRVVELVGECLSEALGPRPGGAQFVGHLGGDDLVLLCPTADVRELASQLAEAFDERIRELFDDRDLERGFFVAVDRQGGPHRYPITTLSMGAVDLSKRAYARSFQVLEACREVKAVAKTHERSCLFTCRRGPPVPSSDGG